MARKAKATGSKKSRHNPERKIKEVNRASVEEMASDMRKHRDMCVVNGSEERIAQANKRDRQADQAIADREGLLSEMRQRGDY